MSGVRLAGVILSAAILCIGQETPKVREALSVADVIRLAKTGVSEEVIVARIKKNGKAFDLSADEISEVKREGLSDSILKYLIDPSLPYTPPPPPAPPAPGAPAPAPPAAPPPPIKKYAADKFAEDVPPEPGAYLLSGRNFVKVELRSLLPSKGSGLGSKVTAGLVKAKLAGHLAGGKAKARAGKSPVFYLRLDSGKIDEIVLVELAPKGERRELQMGGEEKKPSLKVESMKPFDPIEVGAKLFRVTTPPMKKGEYLFYLAGTADPQKGSQGKGYDFGID